MNIYARPEYHRMQGMSLVEVLVVLAILSVSTLALMHSMDLQARTSVHSDNQIQFRELREQIADRLADTDLCTANFGGSRLTSDITRNQIVDTSGKPIYQTVSTNSAAIYGSVQISRISMHTFIPQNPSDPANLNGFATLDLHFVPTKKGFGGNFVVRSVQVFVKVVSRNSSSSDNQRISECSSRPIENVVQSIADICINKRSAILQDDSIVYCPNDYPLLVSCLPSDNDAPPSITDMGGICANDGSCDTKGLREDLAEDGIFLERVYKMMGAVRIEGCLTYDDKHSRGDYRLDLYCCR